MQSNQDEAKPTFLVDPNSTSFQITENEVIKFLRSLPEFRESQFDIQIMPSVQHSNYRMQPQAQNQSLRAENHSSRPPSKAWVPPPTRDSTIYKVPAMPVDLSGVLASNGTVEEVKRAVEQIEATGGEEGISPFFAPNVETSQVRKTESSEQAKVIYRPPKKESTSISTAPDQKTPSPKTTTQPDTHKSIPRRNRSHKPKYFYLNGEKYKYKEVNDNNYLRPNCYHQVPIQPRPAPPPRTHFDPPHKYYSGRKHRKSRRQEPIWPVYVQQRPFVIPRQQVYIQPQFNRYSNAPFNGYRQPPAMIMPRNGFNSMPRGAFLCTILPQTPNCFY